jgi:hypothetical protein
MSVAKELEEIRKLLREINRKLDLLTEDREFQAMMRLAEKALKDFLSEEPDLYTVEDLKVRYK